MTSFLAELRRRNVFKVAAAYAIVGWLLAQIAVVFSPALRLPEWVPSLVALLLILGFPVAMFLTWAYELTPEGVKPAPEMSRSASVARISGRRLDFLIIGLLAIALGFVMLEQYVLDEHGGAVESAAAVADAGAGSGDAAAPGADAAAPTREPAGAASPRRLAVLPFVSMSGEPEQEYFSDGISEEVLNVLGNMRQLLVSSRTSSFAFKNSNADLRTIANQLGVDHVLEGSVRKAGNRVRITAQLIDVATDSHLWSETFERELTDVFAIQDEIAENVARALEVGLLGERAARRSGARTGDVEAHDAYLRGVHYLRRLRSEDLARARAELERAIELDPGYAAAYAELGNAFLAAQSYGLMEPADALARAEPMIEEALRLDPRLPEGYLARGTLLAMQGRTSAADDDFRRAVELNTNLARAHFWRARTHFELNRPREAHAALEKALELDPLDAFFNWSMGNVRLAQGNTEDARAYYRRAIELDPSQPNSYAGLGDVEVAMGRLDEALKHYLRGLDQDPGQAHMTPIVGLVYHALGDLERAQAWFDSGAGMLQSGSLSMFFRGFLPLVSRGEDPERLLTLLREVPGGQFAPFGSRLFRKAALATGDIASVRLLHAQFWPELFADPPAVNANNFDEAIDIAWLLAADGESARANRLLEQSLRAARDPAMRTLLPPEWALPMAEVEALALLGREQEALAAMRRVVDNGWRWDWWQVEKDPTLASISGHPDFIAMMMEVKIDLAVQLERVHAMEQNGDIDPQPRMPGVGR